MQNKKFISLIKSYKICLEIAGEKASSYKKTLVFYTLAYISQGFAFVFFYPLLNNIISENYKNSYNWLMVILVFFIINIYSRWNANKFDYTPEASEINHSLRLKIGEKLRKIPLQKLRTYRTGELNSILSSGVDESVLMMGFISGMLLEAIILPTMILIAAFVINFKMAFIILIAFFLAMPIYKLKRTMSTKEKESLRVANEALESDAIEYIQGINVLKSLNLVGKNAQNLQKSIKEVEKAQRKTMLASTIMMSAVGIIIDISVFLILLIGSFLVLENTLLATTLVMLIVWILRSTFPLSVFVSAAGMVDVMNVAFSGIKKLLAFKELEARDDKIPSKFDIEFQNISFSYENTSTFALKDINFKIQESTITAIVGDSGSGKTTIAKLLMRYADPQSGSIKIGGIDIKDIKNVNLMSKISVVFQDVYLFDDTILNNIKMANPKATDKEVLKAAKSAYCHEFITRLPKGYDTIVGEIGGSLSGGEKQRISIARAILKNAPIIILDEPTSALDTQSEVAVQKALNTLLKDKTIIIIAHRLSTITGADQILVMQENTIKERGTHQELIELNGKYKRMQEALNSVKEWHFS